MPKHPPPKDGFVRISPDLISILYFDIEMADADLTAAEAAPQSEDWYKRLQHFRRQLIRTAFAAVEGEVQILKTLILQSGCEVSGFTVKQKRLMNLSLPPGVTIPRPTALDNVKETVKLFQSTYNFTPMDKAFGGTEWVRFCAAMELRDRLAHPKYPHEMEIEDEEMQDVMESVRWIHELMSDQRRQWWERHFPSGE